MMQMRQGVFCKMSATNSQQESSKPFILEIFFFRLITSVLNAVKQLTSSSFIYLCIFHYSVLMGNPI